MIARRGFFYIHQKFDINFKTLPDTALFFPIAMMRMKDHVFEANHVKRHLCSDSK